MTALISAFPVPVPELVIVPTLLMAVVDKVILFARALLLLITKLPVPVMPPETVNSAVPLLVMVFPLALTEVAPLTVRADELEFSMIPVTLAPTAALIVVVPVPVPVLVTVPALLIAFVDKVIVPVVALLLMVKLLLPVTPPLNVVEMAVPVLPSVNVPVVLDASEIALA